MMNSAPASPNSKPPSSRRELEAYAARLERLAEYRAELKRREASTERKRPSPEALADPVVFAGEVFGLRVWHRQAELLRAVRDHDRVTVTSGHKTGKSTSLAVLAWWFTADPQRRPAARVVLSSASARQVKKILWREIRALYRRAKDRGYELGPEPALDPETGVTWPDGRELLGFSTNEPEKMAGVSGAHLLFLLDEASGIPEEIFEAVEGNRAGGAKVALTSNPTQQSGEFYESHHGKRPFYFTLTISSEEAAEVEPPIPGLATRAWIDEKRAEWGEDSPLLDVRCRGRFAKQASDAVIGLSLVLDAVKRGKDAEDEDDARDPLVVGLDVARFGDDETIAAPRRARRIYPLLVLPEGDGPDTAAALMVALKDAGHLRGGEVPRVNVDANGVGASVYDALKRRKDVEAVAVNTGAAASKSEDYVNLRAELHFAFKDWLKDGGMIPDDGRLQSELVAPKYRADARNRLGVESKDDLRKRLTPRRSPDRGDAAMLSVYKPLARVFDDPGQSFGAGHRRGARGR